MWLNQWPSQKLGYMLAGHNEIFATNSAMNKLFFILMKSIILTHSTWEISQSVGKCTLIWQRNCKIVWKSLTVPKVFVILNFGMNILFILHFRWTSHSEFHLNMTVKSTKCTKLLGHWFRWLWQGTNKGKIFCVWLGLPITTYRICDGPGTVWSMAMEN